MNRFFTLFLILVLTCWLNVANAEVHIPEPVPPSAAVRAAFDLDPFYQQWIDVEGFPVIASAKVNPYAVKEAAWLLRKMIGHRQDILRALVLNKVRFTVIGYTEMTTDIPEYSDRRPAFYWDRRQRGSGGSKNSAVSCTEENLLDFPGDTAPNAFQLIHEFAHAIHHMGLETVDPSFDERLSRVYEAAMRKGLWSGTYAASNRSEYWAEGTHAWIDPKGGSSFKGAHGGNTRAELKTYDPDLATLLTEIYGDGEWRYTLIVTRTHLPHLQGFDPQENPTFRWPADVEETYAQLRDPAIVNGDEWVNLNPYNPSQLSHLNQPRSRQNRTYVLFVNLADFDVLVYRVDPNGTETLLRRIHAQRGFRHAELFSSRVGDVYLVKDTHERSLAVFQAEEQTGRALIGDGRPRNTATNNSPEVQIPDTNLAKAVRNALGIPSSTPLTQQTMQQLTTLNVYRRDVQNLSGLEYATGLTELKLSENQIQDVTPLRGLTRLRELHLHVNRIQDITPIATLTELRELRLRDNQIRDVSALAGFTKLRELWLSGNPIEDKAPLRTLLKRNPNLELDIDISPPVPVVQIGIGQRPSMYWVDADAGTLHRLITDGVENILPNVQNTTSLAIDVNGGKLYWTERTSNRTGKIKRANLDGTNVRLVKNLTSVPYDIAHDAVNGKLYLTNSWGKIQRLNVDNSNFQPDLITDLDTPGNLVLDVPGGKVYWTETRGTSGRIRRANLDGSNVQNVATNLAEPLSLAVGNGKIYWTSARRLHRANPNGINTEILETLPIAPTSIAFDPASNSLYLTLPTGEIHRRDLDGSGTQPIVIGLASPSNIVLGISAMALVSKDTTVPPSTPVMEAADVNQDQKVNKTDLLLVVTALGESPPANPNFDVNADGSVNIADVLLVIGDLDDPVAAAAPSLGETLTAVDPARLAMQIDILRAESDGSLKYEHAIAFFQSLLASLRLSETQLLANYPNPFNPETWIPYELATDTTVRITIYNTQGVVIQTLALGHQSAGYYTGRDQAAYWDGTNAQGEPVASGVYFYTLTAGEFRATRKLLIQK